MPEHGGTSDTGAVPIEKGRSLWQDAFRRLAKNRLALFGTIVLGATIVVALITPWITPFSYEEQDLALGASPPGRTHWLGTDILGRDLFTRILYGGRMSLMVGFAATSVALLVGVTYGATAGYLGGRTDSIMMRLVDILYALPFTIFVIILMVFVPRDLRALLEMLRLDQVFSGLLESAGSKDIGIVLLFMAIGAVEWLTMARIVRGQVLSLRKKEYIEAAVAMGLRKRRILARHIIPNSLGPIIVYATLTVPNVMLLEAFLSFLGLGVQPPMSSWGLLIRDGAEQMEEYPWLLIYPSIALSVTLFSLNFLGDGLRDALDPRVSKD